MASVRLPAALRRAILEHARTTRPFECCGILIGRSRPGGIVIESVEAAPNAWAGDRRRRYEIAPDRLLAAHRAARADDREVVGYYHSHPRGAARPSAIDRERAWPHTLYLIVGRGAVPDDDPLRAWRWVDGQLIEEAIE